MEIHIEIPLNAQVNCLDGECGQSLELVIDPDSNQVTHLVVRDLTQEHNERLVPVGMISGTGEDKIHLCCDKNDLLGLDIFCERDVIMQHHENLVQTGRAGYYQFPVTRQLVVESKSIPKGKLSFDQNTIVIAKDGQAGKLEKLLVNPDVGQITHFVVTCKTFLGSTEVNIPISAIENFTSTGILLNLSKKQVRELQKIKSLP